MTGVVFDASALIAFLKGEPGADVVERELSAGGFCGAANWAEVAQKTRFLGLRWQTGRSLLRSYGLTVTSVLEVDAERASALWVRGQGLSLADRLCLALAERLELPALTADQAWKGKHPRAQLIR
ncbi:type II toxin-antitoxin system VapC family toxin [Gryllotalpicola protaetiae]|uniref:Type II toxin-antitoxin system VapC family toxin n=1 Tax=Gryllotalpicola protaetiae TaxID=2419771 RepID=A0A387BRN9_9MICO|nr:type II toxin-antitoxin system VapC family toxin [Gryllotalpicola protaetiae]AYG03607.1 type II toxin-antitoxin system VapC family toxin [Gryllotalpicola protaetiae]